MHQLILFPDIRISDGPCPDYLERCCELGEPQNIMATTTTQKASTDVRNSLKCGLRNEEGVGFKITGNNDNEAEYGVRNKIFKVSINLNNFLRNFPG